MEIGAALRKPGARLELDPPAHGDCTENDDKRAGLEQGAECKILHLNAEYSIVGSLVQSKLQSVLQAQCMQSLL